jgi:hypothetical protein
MAVTTTLTSDGSSAPPTTRRSGGRCSFAGSFDITDDRVIPPVPLNLSHQQPADLRWLIFNGEDVARCGRWSASESEPVRRGRAGLGASGRLLGVVVLFAACVQERGSEFGPAVANLVAVPGGGQETCVAEREQVA